LRPKVGCSFAFSGVCKRPTSPQSNKSDRGNGRLRPHIQIEARIVITAAAFDNFPWMSLALQRGFLFNTLRSISLFNKPFIKSFKSFLQVTCCQEDSNLCIPHTRPSSPQVGSRLAISRWSLYLSIKPHKRGTPHLPGGHLRKSHLASSSFLHHPNPLTRIPAHNGAPLRQLLALVLWAQCY
jgi:hypothetical protein